MSRINLDEDSISVGHTHTQHARIDAYAQSPSFFPSFVSFLSLACSLPRSIEFRSFNLTYVLKSQQSSSMDDCYFKEYHNTNGYSSFESKPHTGWFLALTNDGRAKPGPKTASGQRAVEFLSRGV